MKLFQIAALAAAVSLGGSVFAQTPANPVKGIKIVKITGTVNVIKDGAIVMTLKPGDAIPEIKDTGITFSVVDGGIEVQADGKTITAAAGASFTVSADKNEVRIAAAAGAPVAVKSESGHNVVLTPDSEVKMTTTKGKVEIKVEKGGAVVSNASGGETRNVKAGETVSIPAPLAPVAPPAPVVPPAAQPAPAVEPPPTAVIPTQLVEEAKEVSGSNP